MHYITAPSKAHVAVVRESGGVRVDSSLAISISHRMSTNSVIMQLLVLVRM